MIKLCENWMLTSQKNNTNKNQGVSSTPDPPLEFR